MVSSEQEDSITVRKELIPKEKYPGRQGLRKSITFIVFLLFPAIYYYLSPYLSIMGPINGVISGSLIMFSLMFISAIFLGRAWCGWVCPVGGGQDVITLIFRKQKRIRIRTAWIKWLIFIPWIGTILLMPILIAIRTSNYTFQGFDFFYLTDKGLSLTRWQDYPIYYLVVFIVFFLSYVVGRRSFCHHVCWMAPFMIIGRKIGNWLRIPSLRLKAKTDSCINCHRCTKECPMSLDVEDMVLKGQLEHSSCILCGTCVDVCPKGVITYAFSPYNSPKSE